VATTGRLAQAGTDAATDALGGVPGTFCGFQIIQSHINPPP
jgi:hypothetical protein